MVLVCSPTAAVVDSRCLLQLATGMRSTRVSSGALALCLAWSLHNLWSSDNARLLAVIEWWGVSEWEWWSIFSDLCVLGHGLSKWDD